MRISALVRSDLAPGQEDPAPVPVTDSRVSGPTETVIKQEMTIPTCRSMAEMVTDYMEGTLTWPVRLAARLHLLQCGACRRYFDQISKTVRLLSEAPAPAPPEPVVERLVVNADHHRDEAAGS
jgi:hypothetical protein